MDDSFLRESQVKDLKFNVRVSGWNLESKSQQTANPETKTLYASSEFPAETYTPRHIQNA